MSLRHTQLLLCALILFPLLSNCKQSKTPQFPQNGAVLTPLMTSSEGREHVDANLSATGHLGAVPLVDLGDGFRILALLDINLDLDLNPEQPDEQVIVALPLNNPEAPLQLLVASINTRKNQYDIAWTEELIVRNLTEIILRADDLTGNGRNDIIITGFAETGEHVTEVFAVSQGGKIADFQRVFSLSAQGNIDILSVDRSPGYYSGLSTDVPFRIKVQIEDPTSDTGLDIIETVWQWNSSAFAYQPGESRAIKTDRILEERLEAVYLGDTTVYENYLKGAWYLETGNSDFFVMLYFDPGKREIMFYNGSIQEVFSWGGSHRTTAKRLNARITNVVIPSISHMFSVSAETWDRIEIGLTSAAWNGIYRRLGPSLQAFWGTQSSLPSIVSDISLSGVWRTSDAEIIFDLPKISWFENAERRHGTASLFNLGDSLVLQIQFMKVNGSLEESMTWKVDYTEDQDATRIIRSLSLTPAELRVEGLRSSGTVWRRYEQIEVIPASQ